MGDTWNGIPLVLARPDQHIAWRSRTEPTAADSTALLTTVTGGI